MFTLAIVINSRTSRSLEPARAEGSWRVKQY